MTDEKLDDPTLQIDPVEWRFSVWLDGDLIYTDCLRIITERR